MSNWESEGPHSSQTRLNLPLSHPVSGRGKKKRGKVSFLPTHSILQSLRSTPTPKPSLVSIQWNVYTCVHVCARVCTCLHVGVGLRRPHPSSEPELDHHHWAKNNTLDTHVNGWTLWGRSPNPDLSMACTFILDTYCVPYDERNMRPSSCLQDTKCNPVHVHRTWLRVHSTKRKTDSRLYFRPP